MNKPKYTSAAHQDLHDILDFIARDKPNAAISWVESIEAKCKSIAANPGGGTLQPHLGDGVRVSILGRYMIFYREQGERVEILRIIPGGKDVTHH